MAESVKAYIGLGSNLDRPLAQVTGAVAELAGLAETSVLAQSPWYSSAAVGPGEQPDYINGVVCLQTELAPLALLDALQHIEQAHHRVRKERWGPRTLDLDILLYGNQVIDEPRLCVPHPWLTRRNFVLVPLADIAPELVLPNGLSVKSLAHNISYEGLECLSRHHLPDRT